MRIRATVEADLDRVAACTGSEPVDAIGPDQYRSDLADGQYRPEWTWIAEAGDEILARALWWGLPESAHPLVLDCVYVHDSVSDRVALAADLLDTGHRHLLGHGMRALPNFEIRVANDWRQDPAATAAVVWRKEAAAAAGLTSFLERLRYEWTADVGVPAQSGRLKFRSEPDDERFVSAFRRVAEGSLDAITRRSVAALGVDRHARDEVEFYSGLPGERDWWRLAETVHRRIAGLAIPSATPNGPTVGFVGVVPELRGNRYVDDLLAEITRIHAALGATRVTALTDAANRPMAAAFDRAGYLNTAVRLVLSADATTP
jgi:hypothetical protein